MQFICSLCGYTTISVAYPNISFLGCKVVESKTDDDSLKSCFVMSKNLIEKVLAAPIGGKHRTYTRASLGQKSIKIMSVIIQKFFLKDVIGSNCNSIVSVSCYKLLN